MATFVLTIHVPDDDHDLNGIVRDSAFELSERVLDDVKPARMEVDDSIQLFEEGGCYTAELTRIE